MNTTAKKPHGNQKKRDYWLFVSWLLVSFLWIYFGTGECLPSYRADYNKIVNYSDLLRQHSTNILQDPLFVLSIALLVSGIILYRAKQWLVGLLLIPLVPFACFISLGGTLCDHTTLHHIAAVEFDGSIYHLTLGNDVAGGWDISTDVLFLFKCVENTDSCQGQEIARYLSGAYEKPDLRLLVDATHNQLQVINGDEVVYTLDPE